MDVAHARREVRAFAAGAGMPVREAEELVLAVSELATNLVIHAGGGVLTCRLRESGDDRAVEVCARDVGPGIADLSRAMADGYSTTGSLGSGLPSARRLVDSFQVQSGPEGTTIELCKWIPEH